MLASGQISKLNLRATVVGILARTVDVGGVFQQPVRGVVRLKYLLDHTVEGTPPVLLWVIHHQVNNYRH